ncbi:hypothetical protein HNY73_001108 [Argiope bruennichi]|uniref:Uncharacterized protein n=1 Tax=Argiope bruennichi TaxID=94029 RepID=A0A8T0G092_ARGBR|nr:hypothetical protein HNY73_001108 [Argiope bruennichi]
MSRNGPMCLQESDRVFHFLVDIAFLTGARLPPVSFRSSFVGPYQLEAPGLWQLLCGIGCQNDLRRCPILSARWPYRRDNSPHLIHLRHYDPSYPRGIRGSS